MQISKRLEAISEMVTSGFRIADIGTDHAYIPIYLARAGKIPHAIAMDVNKGPLQKARENIGQYGLDDMIETRLSDGLCKLKPGETDSIIIAGMGGPLTIRILTEGADRLSGCRELILQPQSEIKLVRAFLEREGWQIVREEMICEDGKYYPMMRAVQDGDAKSGSCMETPTGSGAARMTAVQLGYGPCLLAARHPVLHEFLLREQSVNLRIVEALKGQRKEASVKRLQEVEEELAVISQALRVYEE